MIVIIASSSEAVNHSSGTASARGEERAREPDRLSRCIKSWRAGIMDPTDNASVTPIKDQRIVIILFFFLWRVYIDGALICSQLTTDMRLFKRVIILDPAEVGYKHPCRNISRTLCGEKLSPNRSFFYTTTWSQMLFYIYICMYIHVYIHTYIHIHETSQDNDIVLQAKKPTSSSHKTIKSIKT